MIEIRDFSKKYGNRKLFNHFYASFNNNGLYAILGKSGCGKSTLLNCMSTLDPDYEGDIIIDGTYLKALNDEQIKDLRINKFGFIFQSFNLFENESVYNNVKLVQFDACKDLRETKENEVDELLKKLEIFDIKDELVKYLSGGEKQRVAIARALINHPTILFCDEPTGSLDDKNSDKIFEILQEISKESLVIVVTHDKTRARQYANYIFRLTKNDFILNKKIDHKKYVFPNKGKEGKIGFSYILRSIKNTMKSRKLRYSISTIMFSLSLICLGLTIFVSDNISRGINKSFSNLISNNSLILRHKGSSSPLKIVALDKKEVEKIFDKYNFDIDYFGTKFIIDYKEFFPDKGNFYIEKGNVLHNFFPLTVSSINNFNYINFDKITDEKFYPKINEKLNDDEIILSLDYQNMEKICLLLRIERSYESLGNYLKNNELKFILKTKNSSWNYEDEQIFKLKSVIIKPKVEIFHTSNLFNETIFKDYMRFPSSSSIYSKHDLPWIMNQIYYLKTNEFPENLLTKIQYDDEFKNLIFEPNNSTFSPNICVDDELCYSNEIYLLKSLNDVFQSSIINKIKSVDQRFENYYFSTPGGYMNYGGSLFNGFSKEMYFSSDKKKLDSVEDAFQKVNINDYEHATFPKDVARGYALDTCKNNVKFSIHFDGKYVGSKEFMANNIAISSALNEKLSKSSLLNKDIYLMLNYETKSDNKYYFKKFKKIKLKVIGIVESNAYKIYQNKDFSISLFRDLFQVSSLELIPDSIIYEFNKKPNKNDIKKVNESLSDYEIIDPYESINSSMDEIFKYFDISLLVFTVFTSVSTLILMFVINAINFEDDKKEIAIYQMLGFKSKEINKTQLCKNFSYTLPALFSSIISLILISIILGKTLQKTIGLEIGFSFPIFPIIAVIIFTIIMTFISYFAVTLNIKRAKLTNELHKMT